MKTNLEKFNYWKGIIDAREKEFTDRFISEIPPMIYMVYSNGKICEMIVTGLDYRNEQRLFHSGKPSRELVEKTKSFAESHPILQKENITIRHEQKQESGSIIGRINIGDLNKYFTTIEAAKKKSDEITSKYAAEEELVKSGHVRCQRCRKVVPPNEAVSEKIISYATYGPAGRAMMFCSRLCATHEQWAHEG